MFAEFDNEENWKQNVTNGLKIPHKTYNVFQNRNFTFSSNKKILSSLQTSSSYSQKSAYSSCIKFSAA